MSDRLNRRRSSGSRPRRRNWSSAACAPSARARQPSDRAGRGPAGATGYARPRRPNDRRAAADRAANRRLAAKCRPTAKPSATTYKERRAAQLVKDGKLPPVEQRLPTNPRGHPARRTGHRRRLGRAHQVCRTTWPRQAHGAAADQVGRAGHQHAARVPNVIENGAIQRRARLHLLPAKASSGRTGRDDHRRLTFWWQDMQGNKTSCRTQQLINQRIAASSRRPI